MRSDSRNFAAAPSRSPAEYRARPSKNAVASAWWFCLATSVASVNRPARAASTAAIGAGGFSRPTFMRSTKKPTTSGDTTEARSNFSVRDANGIVTLAGSATAGFAASAAAAVDVRTMRNGRVTSPAFRPATVTTTRAMYSPAGKSAIGTAPSAMRRDGAAAAAGWK